MPYAAFSDITPLGEGQFSVAYAATATVDGTAHRVVCKVLKATDDAKEKSKR